MTASKSLSVASAKQDEMVQHLAYLKLPFTAEHYVSLAKQAAQKQRTHVDYLATLMQGEADLKRERAIQNRIRQARFPVVKTLAQFRWD